MTYLLNNYLIKLIERATFTDEDDIIHFNCESYLDCDGRRMLTLEGVLQKSGKTSYVLI